MSKKNFLMKKIDRALMSEGERALYDAKLQATIYSNSILYSPTIQKLTQYGLEKAQQKHVEALQKLENDFISTNLKNNQIHEEISRVQDQTDAMIDAAFTDPSNVDKEMIFRMMDSIDKSSAAIASLRAPQKRTWHKKKSDDADKTVILDQDDYRSI